MLKYVFESTGFVLKSSKPAKIHFCFSSSDANAVTATIFGLSNPEIERIFSHDRIPVIFILNYLPLITGIFKSMSISRYGPQHNLFL